MPRARVQPNQGNGLGTHSYIVGVDIIVAINVHVVLQLQCC